MKDLERKLLSTFHFFYYFPCNKKQERENIFSVRHSFSSLLIRNSFIPTTQTIFVVSELIFRMLFSFYCCHYYTLVRISRIKRFHSPVLFVLVTAHNCFNRDLFLSFQHWVLLLILTLSTCPHKQDDRLHSVLQCFHLENMGVYMYLN